jgi:enamine deaminase RidA (YjgF/YER057c/UK114 family)
MGRVINVNNPTKIRNRNKRTIAEILRRLMDKPTLDQESKDMAAQIVLCLEEINATIEQTVSAWEKRDYWMKAERFLRDWEWSKEVAYNLDDIVRHDAWDLFPQVLGELLPQIKDVQVKTMTRDPLTWKGALKQLMEQDPIESPW